MKWILVAAMIVGATGGASSAQAAGKEKKRAVAAASSSMTDTVLKVRDDDEGIVVYFVAAKGSYRLQRSVAGFDVIQKKLEASRVGKKPVSVTFDAVELNILEVK